MTDALLEGMAEEDGMCDEPCFCDTAYPDANPDVTCGDCPRDYARQAAEQPIITVGHAQQENGMTPEQEQAEIERLRAEVEALRTALKSIAEGCSFPSDDVQRAVRDRARAALAQIEQEKANGSR